MHLPLAAALLDDLIGYEEIQQPILMGLVGMLKATEDSAPGTAPSATSVPNPLLGTSSVLIGYLVKCTPCNTSELVGHLVTTEYRVNCGWDSELDNVQ